MTLPTIDDELTEPDLAAIEPVADLGRRFHRPGRRRKRTDNGDAEE